MAPNDTFSKDMQSFSARYNTFQTAHQLSKRRASSQTSASKRKGGNTVEWPHEQPSAEDLARAGFFYRPAQDSLDNVQCFLCGVKLDGWESNDNALAEHLAHSGHCAWAQMYQAGIAARQNGDASQDPMSEELIAARKATFTTGAGWPHEGKKGWKCKVAKMVEAGWCLDPALPSAGEVEDEEELDGVTCFYCELSLDGWEPKDDPLAEHKRRAPDCAFFALTKKFGHTTAKKGVKGKGKKAGARASTASKASARSSTQSAISIPSQEPSFADMDAGLEVSSNVETAVDTSIISAASQATATESTKGRKKTAKPKAVKGRKRANTVESQLDAEPLYPDLAAPISSQAAQEDDLPVSSRTEELAVAPTTKARKGSLTYNQATIDSSIIDPSSSTAPGPIKKANRGRKPKAQPQSEIDAEEALDNSDVSQQLQEELERSMSMDMQDEVDDATPQQEPALKPKRGTKRTSAGQTKEQQDESDVSIMVVEFPVPPKPAAPAKGKRGRQASKQIAAVEEHQIDRPSQQPATAQDDMVISEVEAAPPKATKAKRASAAKAKSKVKKISSARSSRSSKATVVATEPTGFEQDEDLERDEREIEAELERIAAEQASLGREQDKAAEFEPSPSHKKADHESSSRRQSAKIQASTAPQLPPLNLTATPSPSGSDKENQPSSAFNPPTAKQIPVLPQPFLSPTKPTRIPLAPGTPNRAPLSPSKRSPNKQPQQLSRLTSTNPWLPIDLENVLSMSPQPTPNTLASRLAGAAGRLASPEKDLTVEAWVRRQAEKAEEELRRRCEEMVGAFEREAVKALGSLEGIVVTS